jgi:hypothetical protein
VDYSDFRGILTQANDLGGLPMSKRFLWICGFIALVSGLFLFWMIRNSENPVAKSGFAPGAIVFTLAWACILTSTIWKKKEKQPQQ